MSDPAILADFADRSALGGFKDAGFTDIGALESKQAIADSSLTVMAVAIFFFLFYIVGSFASRRKVSKIYATILETVSLLGGRVVSGRIGVTTAVVSGRDVGRLAEFTVVVGVQTWSNPLTYLISRSMGREDLAILRAKMKNVPPFSLTFIRKGSPAAKYASKWGALIREFDDYLVTTFQAKAPFDVVSKLHHQLSKTRGIHILSIRERLPHLEVYFSAGCIPDLKNLLSFLEELSAFS